MEILILIVVLIVMMFAAVLLYGAPYLPTLSNNVETALDLLDLKKGQTMLELGCGDGRMLVAAARREIHSVGYELNPVLYLYARIRTLRYKNYVSVKFGNYWTKKWPKADGMYVFLLERYMNKLDNKIVQYANKKSFKLVSFAFKIEGKKPAKESSGMFLYKY